MNNVVTPAPGVSPGAGTLPSSTPSFEYEIPEPNPEMLKTILLFDGCPEQYVDTITAGYAPREFLSGMTRYWKIRDAFYRLAARSFYCFREITPMHYSLQQIAPMIVGPIHPQTPFGLQLTNAMNSVRWKEFFCAGSCFVWPWDIPRIQGDINSPPPFWGRDLLTAIRLTILYRIWCLNPILCSVDFSLGLGGFTSEERTNVQRLIRASIQAGSAVSPTEEPQVVSESTLTDQTFTSEVQQLLDILQDGEKSRQELQEKLGVGRTVLLKHFLDPAREAGLVTPTEQGSSPNQKYRLTSSEAAVNRKQVQTGSETGLKKPVFSGDDLPQKQAGLPKNGVLSPMAFSCFAGGHAPVRLARYVRWSEAERALIMFGRVERFLRSSFASEEWKKLGIVNKLNTNDLSSFEDFLFDSKYWGANCGVVLRKEVVDNNGNQWAIAIGESNLLNLIAQKAGLDLAVCSEAECAEMSRLAAVIPPDVLHLVNFYAQRFSISRDLDKPYHGDPKAMQSVAVEPFNLYSPFMTKIVFHGKDRAPRLHVGRVDVDDRTLLLPFTFYASSKNPVLHCMMPEVPDRPALYNADAIAANSGATVILTDEIGIPLVNDSDSDFIYCSWYGGMDVHEKVVPELPPGQPCR